MHRGRSGLKTPVHPDIPDWDDLRLFLALAKAGSFLAAARGLGIDHATVARRISGLEAALGARLTERSRRGISLTAEGQVFLEHASRIENEVRALRDTLGGSAAGLDGVVRLSLPESFATGIVSSRISRFSDEYPDIKLVIHAHHGFHNAAEAPADVVVSINRQVQPEMLSFRLGDFRLGLFASPRLIERFGPIATMEAITSVPFVYYGDPSHAEFEDLLRNLPRENVVLRSTSVAVRRASVESGRALGVLASYSLDAESELVAILPEEVSQPVTLWCSVHPSQHRLPRIQAVIQFVKTMIAEIRP